MFGNIHNATLTNWVADREGGTSFYTLAKYWTAHHDCPKQEWEADDGQELFLEVRSYVGPAPRQCVDHKFILTPSQYALLLFEVSSNGPDSAATYIETQRESWLTATGT